MRVRCHECKQSIEMATRACPKCGVDRAVELKHANASGAAIVGAQLLSVLIGFIVAGTDGALLGSGFGTFLGFATVTFYKFAT